MSPRSLEFMEQARDRLSAARESLDAKHLGVAVSIAYYAMLYAARSDHAVEGGRRDLCERRRRLHRGGRAHAGRLTAQAAELL